MIKSYSDCMKEISPDELYKGLLAHGMFSFNLPPVFTSESFFQYCQTTKTSFKDRSCNYITFDSMRQTNVPRTLGIPHPVAYQSMCRCLKENWDNIQNHFDKYTSNNQHKISRIHIRKMEDKPFLTGGDYQDVEEAEIDDDKSVDNNDTVESEVITYKPYLFDMNYKNWREDGTPELEYLLGSKYVVRADISTCFPSIYSHAICWALATDKEEAKMDRRKGWFNKIDRVCMNVKNGETHGLLIGPHASNLIAEIVLTRIDSILYKKGWRYLRYIDDYRCFVKSYEDAQRFILELSVALREYDLPLNYKKTAINELPVALEKDWKNQLKTFSLFHSYKDVKYPEASAYLDLAIRLMKENDMDASILKYAIKTLSGQPMTSNSKLVCTKQAMHLAIVFPYLLPLMDECIFKRLSTEVGIIERFANALYDSAKVTMNFEAYCYAIYFSLRYGFPLQDISSDDFLSSNDCLHKLFGMLYFKRYGKNLEIEQFRDHAKKIIGTSDMDRNWAFVYETLEFSEMKDDWKRMKQDGITFIRKEYL